MAGKKKDPSASAAACAQKALKISAKARYALRALIDVASHAESDSPRTGAAIAKEQHLSEKFSPLEKHHRRVKEICSLEQQHSL